MENKKKSYISYSSDTNGGMLSGIENNLCREQSTTVPSHLQFDGHSACGAHLLPITEKLAESETIRI